MISIVKKSDGNNFNFKGVHGYFPHVGEWDDLGLDKHDEAWLQQLIAGKT